MTRVPAHPRPRAPGMEPLPEEGGRAEGEPLRLEPEPRTPATIDATETVIRERRVRRLLRGEPSSGPLLSGGQVTKVRDLMGTAGIRGPWRPSGPSAAEESSTRPRIQEPLAIDPAEPAGPDEVMVATYNVENLFDTADDPRTKDEEFTPRGKMRWTEEKLNRKVDNLGRVLRSTNGGQGPDFVGLVEVENREVVEKLRDRGLHGLGYRSVIHVEGEDVRGIDNAILSKHPLVGEPTLHRVHDSESKLWEGRTTRGILEATFDVRGRKLTVFVNHWPSKRGGAQADAQRNAVARELRALVDARLAEDPGREIVLLGDFNAHHGEESLAEAGLRAQAALRSGSGGDGIYDTTLGSPAGSLQGATSEDDGHRMGTHYYHPERRWSTFDHIFVSGSLLDHQGLTWVPGSTQVVREPFMVTGSGAPKRFYQPRVDPGQQALENTGFSDHLPVVARLRIVS